ncbi:MAG: general stress protein [Pseudomonadota bacterium]|nr:general stress protein [Pseudomonadota bacterium]
MKTVVGLFDSLSEAQSATRDLITAGYSRDDIGVLASDATGEWSRYKTSSLEGPAPMSTLEGAAPGSEEVRSGVGTGTMVGGLGGLLVGLTSFAIPGIGWLAGVGTLATTLLGASMGGAAGGLFTAVEKLGVPKDKTGYYAEALRQGGTLVLVRLAEEQVDEAMAIMERHQAVDIEQRAEKWRASGWTGFNEAQNP